MATEILTPTTQVVPFPSPSVRRSVAVRLAERLYGDGRGHAYAENVLQNSKPSKVVSLLVS